jgi:hypothetical protein
MRLPYTCVFKNLLSSRVWAQPPAARAVWLWLQLAADPEGFVSADMAGVALGANVPLAEARQAMEVFEAPDEDADPDDPNEGRVVARVKGGWLIVDFEAARERAKHEAEKGRKRRYQAMVRAKAKRAANDVASSPTPDDISGDTVSTCRENIEELDAKPEKLDQPKPTPKTKPFPSEGERIPLPPSGVFDAPTLPVVHRTLEGWEPSEALRAEAAMQGVSDFDERLATLRTGPIGGERGVLDRDAYVRAQLPKWRRWRETERARTLAAPVARPGARGVVGAPPEPSGQQRAFAARHGIPIEPIIAELVKRNYTTASYGPKDLDRMLTKFLIEAKRAKEGAA